MYSTCKTLDGGTHQNNVNGYGTENGDVSTGTLFTATFTSKSASLDGFAVYGNLGADGGGTYETLNLTASGGVYGYYKQVYGAQGDPSISHLILTRAPPSALTRDTLSYSTDSDYQRVSFSVGQELIIYMLWAGKLPSSIPGLDVSLGARFVKRDVQRVLDAVAGSCFSLLSQATVPPSPPPSPSPPPVTPDCDKPCNGGTCRPFLGFSCSTLRQKPWSCDCGSCCSDHVSSPPPPPPPSPPKLPLPSSPDMGSCSRQCGSSTCGALNPSATSLLACTDFEALGCDCSGCCASPLDARCVDNAWPANLPALYNFQEGTRSYYIRDGGRDMFDVGNEILLRVNGRWSSPLFYNQVCDGSRAHPVGNAQLQLGDAQYVTCKLPLSPSDYDNAGFGAAFVFIATSKSGSIDGFMTNGNLGADEKGTQRFNDGGSALHGPKGTIGYYKQTFGANSPGVSLSDPSVNHLVFGKGLDGAVVKVGSTTDSDLHELHFKHGVSQLYFILWAGKEGYEYPTESFQQVLERLGTSCFLAGDEYAPSFAPTGSGGGGGGGGTLVVLLLLGLICCGAAYYYAKKNGVRFENILDKVPGMRARTSPSGSSTIATPPMSTTAPLAVNDSAGFQTAYTPPPS